MSKHLSKHLIAICNSLMSRNCNYIRNCHCDSCVAVTTVVTTTTVAMVTEIVITTV